MTVVDVHAHFIPKGVVEKADPLFGIKSYVIDGERYVEVEGEAHGPVIRTFTDVEGRLKDLDAFGIDQQVVCLPPWLFMYWHGPSVSSKYARLVNDEMHFVLKGQDRIFPMATVGLRDVREATRELERAVSQLGFCGVSIGSNLEPIPVTGPVPKGLDDESLWPFYETVERLDVPIFIHPIKVGGADRMRYYYLPVLVGGPADTTIATANLIFGGVMDHFPRVKFYLAHGGGNLPFLRGRLEKGLAVRPETKMKLPKKNVEEYYRSFYFDTVVYEATALQFLVDTAPRDHIMFGSDLPSEMAIENGVNYVKSLKLNESDQRLILGENARRVFHLS